MYSDNFSILKENIQQLRLHTCTSFFHRFNIGDSSLYQIVLSYLVESENVLARATSKVKITSVRIL